MRFDQYAAPYVPPDGLEMMLASTPLRPFNWEGSTVSAPASEILD